MRNWRLRGNRSSPACIRFQHRSPASDMMACITIRIFDRCPGLRGTQVCHSMKTSGLGLLRDWPATSLQPIRLMKCSIDL
ncbi:hypothetical protein TNCV_718371 [Trichonephila clavipes]|nr:hypothetical protein TNCV_718371 [Trichonephila clavipes]